MKSVLFAAALAVAVFCTSTPSSAAERNPIFGNAKVATVSKTQAQEITAKGALSNTYGYYGYYYAYYAYYYGYYGYYYSSNTYYYYAAQYATYAQNYLYAAYILSYHGY